MLRPLRPQNRTLTEAALDALSRFLELPRLLSASPAIERELRESEGRQRKLFRRGRAFALLDEFNDLVEKVRLLAAQASADSDTAPPGRIHGGGPVAADAAALWELAQSAWLPSTFRLPLGPVCAQSGSSAACSAHTDRCTNGCPFTAPWRTACGCEAGPPRNGNAPCPAGDAACAATYCANGCVPGEFRTACGCEASPVPAYLDSRTYCASGCRPAETRDPVSGACRLPPRS
eukprot:tig00000492_g1398.t1